MATEQPQCPFCNPLPRNLWIVAESGFAVRDTFPISAGHTLVVPRIHISSFHDLKLETQLALWQLVAEVRCQLADRLRPDGFNVGLNDGEAAGQTVMHAHIHVIPRWKGDVADPRGGVRWIIPDKARYWDEE